MPEDDTATATDEVLVDFVKTLVFTPVAEYT